MKRPPKTSDDARPRSTAQQMAGLSHDLVVETPIAIVFNGTTAAVMMASPSDIEDFALGFAMTEGIIEGPQNIKNYEQLDHDRGVEARFMLQDGYADRFTARRRAMMGPVGCGLCGIESLDSVFRDLPIVSSSLVLDQKQIILATQLLRQHQPLHDQTRSAHGAGFYVPDQGIVMMREDVGRHNALDKLIGALVTQNIAPESGAIIMTSRLSVELVQKAAMFGCPILVGVSGPTSLAVQTARKAGITLIGFSRADGFDVFSDKQQIVDSEDAIGRRTI